MIGMDIKIAHCLIGKNAAVVAGEVAQHIKADLKLGGSALHAALALALNDQEFAVSVRSGKGDYGHYKWVHVGRGNTSAAANGDLGFEIRMFRNDRDARTGNIHTLFDRMQFVAVELRGGRWCPRVSLTGSTFEEYRGNFDPKFEMASARDEEWSLLSWYLGCLDADGEPLKQLTEKLTEFVNRKST